MSVVPQVVELDALGALVDGTLGPSEWVPLDQEVIDAFGRVTRDEQWIHSDPERAASGPFGGTIAHGYLTLSLCSHYLEELLSVRGAGLVINYGLDRVRFISPVPSGSSVRGAGHVVSVSPAGDGIQVVVRWTVEVQGGTKPACVADMVLRYAKEQPQ